MRVCVSLNVNETDIVVVKNTNSDIISTPHLVTRQSAWKPDEWHKFSTISIQKKGKNIKIEHNLHAVKCPSEKKFQVLHFLFTVKEQMLLVMLVMQLQKIELLWLCVLQCTFVNLNVHFAEKNFKFFAFCLQYKNKHWF